MSKPKERRSSAGSLGRQRFPVNNYYSSSRPREESTSSAKRNVMPKGWLFKAVELLIVVVLGLVLAFSLVVNPDPKVSASDSTYHSASEYQRFLFDKMSSFKNRNKITFDEGEVVNSLKQKYPEVQNVSVELPVIGQRPLFKLDIAAPAFFLKSGTDTYLISSNGVATGLQNAYPSLSAIPLVTDNSGYQTKIGRQVLSAQDVAFIQAVFKETKIYGVPVSKIELPKAPEQLNLYTSDTPYYTKFFMAGDPAVQSGQFIAARKQFSNSDQKPQQYLDVRVVGKIFYK